MLNQVASPEMDQETGSLLEVADVVVREVLEVLVVTVVFLEGIPEVVVFLEDILEAVAFQGVSLLAHQDTE